MYNWFRLLTTTQEGGPHTRAPTRSTLGVEEPGHPDEKLATGTRHTWSRTERQDTTGMLLHYNATTPVTPVRGGI